MDPMTDTKTKALVLLSGGQDSTTSLFWAKDQGWDVHALSLWYGQRHQAELDAAAEIAKMAGVPHEVLVLPQGTLGGSALVDASQAIEGEGGLVDAEMPQGLPTSFVPGRNMVFLAIASARAAVLGCTELVTGVCQTDYSGYPDCRASFIEAMNAAVAQAMPSSVSVQIHAPLMHVTKADTVRMATLLPGCMEALARSVTCYHGERPGCGACPACELRAAGFAEAGVQDPAGR